MLISGSEVRMDELVRIIEGAKNFDNFWSKKKKNDCKSVELVSVCLRLHLLPQVEMLEG